ncbi:hypothetical protein BHE74_00056128 [Ensete ventricosum]|nr:hypothetical protein BHE74_00056128 [Ensete ventricosum]
MRAVAGLKEQAVKSIKDTVAGLTFGSQGARRLSGGLDSSSHDFKPAEVTRGEGQVKRAEESLRTTIIIALVDHDWGPVLMNYRPMIEMDGVKRRIQTKWLWTRLYQSWNRKEAFAAVVGAHLSLELSRWPIRETWLWCDGFDNVRTVHVGH